MSVVSKEDIQNIRNNVNIVDLISSYVSLSKRGKNYFGVCPFHDDNNPSMSVSEEKQIYTCFSCGATGNVFNFLMDYEHISFKEALKIAADRAGISLDIDVSSKKETTNPVYAIYEFTNKVFKNNLNTKFGTDAKKYLGERQISDEVIKEFEIGLALNEKDALTKLLLKKEFDKNDILKSGLVLKNEKGMYDAFYDRIMFPLWDLSGNVIAYSGRDYNGKYSNKYVNTKETELFKKGEILYNYHRCKNFSRTNKKVIVMEGFMDVIMAYEATVKNVVATMGTAFTDKHANLLKRLANEVVLCFDSDDAGVKATISAAEILLKNNVVPKVVSMPEGLDPDDYIKKHGKDAFVSLLDNPVDFIDFKLKHYKKTLNLDNSEDLSKYINLALSTINNIDDDILVEVSLNKLASESGLEKEFLKSKLTKKDKVNEVIKPKPVQTKSMSKYEIAERNLVYYMLNDANVVQKYIKKVSYLPSKKYRDVAKHIVIFYKKHKYVNVADIITELDDNESVIQTIGFLNSLDLNSECSSEEINDYIAAIEEYNFNFSISILNKQLKETASPVEKASIVQEILDLKKRRDSND